MIKAEAFPSKYLSAADLQGKAVTVTIHHTTREPLKSPEGKEVEKTILHFTGAKKALPLNLTNWDSVAEICGEDSDGWPGGRITLYPTKVQMGGKMVDAVRIRRPEELRLEKPAVPAVQIPPAHADMEDEIPNF